VSGVESVRGVQRLPPYPSCTAPELGRGRSTGRSSGAPRQRAPAKDVVHVHVCPRRRHPHHAKAVPHSGHLQAGVTAALGWLACPAAAGKMRGCACVPGGGHPALALTPQPAMRRPLRSERPPPLLARSSCRGGRMLPAPCSQQPGWLPPCPPRGCRAPSRPCCRRRSPRGSCRCPHPTGCCPPGRGGSRRCRCRGVGGRGGAVEWSSGAAAALDAPSSGRRPGGP
jgi:hypothetical protein